MVRLAKGEWQPGSRFPTEIELTRHYGLSRPTIRQALAELVQEGYLVRRRGRGTTVTQPTVVDNAQVFTTLDQLGPTSPATETRLLECGLRDPSPTVARELDLAAGERVYEVLSRRSAGSETLAVRQSLVPERLAPGLDREMAALAPGTDVYAVLQDVFHLTPIGAVQTFRARGATRRDAEALGVRRGTPVTVWAGVIYTAPRTKMAHVRTAFRGDRVTFAIRQGRVQLDPALVDRAVGIGILDTIDGRIW